MNNDNAMIFYSNGSGVKRESLWSLGTIMECVPMWMFIKSLLYIFTCHPSSQNGMLDNAVRFFLRVGKTADIFYQSTKRTKK